MNVWPLFLDLTVEPADAKRVDLWLPLFLLWPLLAVIVLVLVGRGYQGYTVLLWRVLAMFGDTKGMRLRFNDKTAVVDMTFL
jgi:hypothetical protein